MVWGRIWQPLLKLQMWSNYFSFTGKWNRNPHFFLEWIDSTDFFNVCWILYYSCKCLRRNYSPYHKGKQMAACLQGNRLQKTALPAFAKCMLVACLSSKVLPIYEEPRAVLVFRTPSESCQKYSGTSLVVQWRGFCTTNAGAQAGFLIRELDPTCFNLNKESMYPS